MKTKLLTLTAVACLFVATASNAQVPSYVPTNGLVGWWPFNGNANDESGNGNNGTVNGVTLVSDRNGNANSAYNFNAFDWGWGTGGDYVYIPYSPIFNSSNLTVSAWFYKASNYITNQNGPTIVKRFEGGYSNPNGQTWGIYVNNTSSNLGSFLLPPNTTNTYATTLSQSGPNITTQFWHNVVLTFDGVNMLTYLDGQLINTTPSNGMLLNTNGNSGISIGMSLQANGNWDPFNGDIDDVGIWSRALTQQEITALYQSNSCSVPAYVPSNGLVGYWPFCGNANDVSGNGNNGTVNGATLTTDRNGDANAAYNFDGSNWVEIPFNSSQNVGAGSFTISCWAVKNGNSSYQHMVTRNYCVSYPDFTTSYNLRYEGAGIRIAGSGSTLAGTTNGSYLASSLTNLNNWNHIAGVFDSGNKTYSIYFNGTLVGSSTYSGTLSSYNNNGSIYFGVENPIAVLPSGSLFLNGKLDDIGIWNRALSALEIQQLYNSTPCTKPEPVTLGTNASTVRCPNDQVSIFVVTPSTSGLSYEWTRNGTSIPGATSSSITVSDVAKYKVFVRSGPGVDCQRVSGLIETTTATPPSVTASAPNGTVYCSGDSVLLSASGATSGYSYQWKRYGVPIAGATSSTYYAKQSGNYRCEITNAGGCISTSNLISISNGTSCRIMQEQTGDVNIFPNPAQSGFTVSFNDIGNETPVSIELRNIHGQTIEVRKVSNSDTVQFNTSKLAPGNYFLKIALQIGDVIEKSVVVGK